MSDIIFTKPLSGEEFGDLMTLDEFLESVEEFFFMDDDGFGLPVKDNMVAEFIWGEYSEDVRVWPSRVDRIPEGTTHILWFNK